MAIAPTIPLAAPPTNPAARRYSILDAAVGPLDLPDGARLADLAYTVPWCGGGTFNEPDCEPVTRTFQGALDIAEAIAFTVERSFTCMAPGSTPEQIETFARGRLEGTEHVLVEAAVALQLAGSTPADLGTAVTIIDAVSVLEQYAYAFGDNVNGNASQGYGLQAVIHMPIPAWAHLADADQIVKEGGVWRTPLGSVVSPNAGLIGDNAYVTGQLVLWRAPSLWLAPTEAALDRTTNEYKMLAQRDYAAAWECFSGVVALGVLA